jgi:anaerobic selenocysteine-containing dehydrogenase
MEVELPSDEQALRLASADMEGNVGREGTMAKVKTTCRLCLVRCGMVVETDAAGKVKRITGDRSHPLSKGYLCVKGNASLDFTLSPKRIVHPMKRCGERGSGHWQRVSWDDALDDIAQRLRTIIDAHGARAVAVQALPPKEYFAYDMFCDVIGSPTFFKHDSHQCFTPQLMSDVLTFGNLLTYPGYNNVEDCDVILLWGMNLPETNASKHERVKDAQKKGARTIVVDPRPVRLAKEAELWLRIRPGTDCALALGMINVIITNGWYDEKFISEWTVGFEELKARAASYTPEKVAEITWIPAKDIRKAAEMFATAGASAIYTFIGATMGGNSIATLRAMGFLAALTGRIDQPGNNRSFAHGGADARLLRPKSGFGPQQKSGAAAFGGSFSAAGGPQGDHLSLSASAPGDRRHAHGQALSGESVMDRLQSRSRLGGNPYGRGSAEDARPLDRLGHVRIPHGASSRLHPAGHDASGIQRHYRIFRPQFRCRPRACHRTARRGA